MMAELLFRSRTATHPGTRRTLNEDRFVDRPDIGLWAVADGAGGHESGDLAAGIIAENLEKIEPGLSGSELLVAVRQRIAEANAALRVEAERRGPEAMLASTVVALLAREGHFACLWAGDSRAYLMRDDVLAPLTHDHSVVQELVDGGTITDEEAERHPSAHVITRAVGAGEELELDKVIGELRPGDRFLLCSDGLSKVVSGPELGATLRALGWQAAASLVEAALAADGSDNVTAVTVDSLPEGEGP
jgi:protein phosphatase/serine/threonine-protein phosphatase Stp1